MDWEEQSLYVVLNEALRKEDRSSVKPWFGYLKLFDTALKKLPSVQKNLWRGISADLGEEYKNKKSWTWWNFNSCSEKVSVVEGFLGSQSTLMMISAKNGKAISEYSKFVHEAEILLNMGTDRKSVV